MFTLGTVSRCNSELLVLQVNVNSLSLLQDGKSV